MRIFVTGGTGFIGSHFLKKALVAGHEVIALRRPHSRVPIQFEREPRWVEGQLYDDFGEIFRDCSCLVHFAAIGVSPQKATWEEYFYWNVSASLKLWLSALRCNVRRIVLCGTCFEYGKTAERYEFIPPDAPLEPIGAYAASKAAASLAALALAREELCELVLLRPFTVYGEGQHESNFWPSLRRAALAGENFPMTLGEQVRDFISVESVANVFLESLQSKELRPGEPYVRNVGTGNSRTLLTFAQEWWHRWDAKGRLLPGKLDYRPNEVMRYVPVIL